ncbi:MAG: alpha/beta fold hydrolase [Brevundimonas sp.]|nr:MAG: alpha/beta fold hydrolase [Brevundimonas sp.]
MGDRSRTENAVMADRSGPAPGIQDPKRLPMTVKGVKSDALDFPGEAHRLSGLEGSMTILSLTVAAAVLVAGAQTPAGELAGRWEGRISAGGQSLRIVLNVDAVGGATLDSPDQGVNGLPVSGLSVTGGVVRFSIPAAGGAFEGALADGGRTLNGVLTQGGASLPLVFSRVLELTPSAPPPSLAPEPVAAARPQTPQAPFPYRSEDVVIPTPTPGVQLAGTLTLPEGAGPFPAVLLITGSGQQDRDETVFGHKPFLVLADALSRRGVAVLRVDDRGVGGSTGPAATATSADFAIDAGASFAFLEARPEIAPDRVGLIGHSEGGTIAPLVAQADPRVAFIVMIAGPAVSGGDLLVEQSRAIQQASGVAPAVVDGNVAIQSRIMRAVAADADRPEAAIAAVDAILAEAGQPPAQRQAVAAQLLAPWTRWFIAHDPQPALSALRIPVLAIYGGKDTQVPAAQNAAALRATLASAEIVVLPNLNHLMQPATTGLVAEYGAIATTFDASALTAIVNWVAER